MKQFYALVGIILFFFTFSTFATTINGRFTILQMDSLKFSVLIQINTNSGVDDLGGTTMVFGFDTTAISFNENPIVNVDYVFNNFSEGNYSPATVTRPMKNKIWVNIDLPFSNNNNGTIVAGSPEWTDVVILNFNMVNSNGMAIMNWLTTSPFWGIFDADNSSLWQTGQFEDLFDPLPVELLSFTGSLLSDNNILLDWKTASSLNNYGFEVQKSYKDSEEWKAIGFVEKYGDPSALVEYNFTDNTIHSYSMVRYRLKIIDNDGSFQYSSVIEVNTLPISYELSQNYPNPFNPSTKIRFAIIKASDINLSIYNVVGELVATLVNEHLNAGYHEYEFNASNISSGIYIYRILADDFVETKKMVLMK